MKKHRLCRGPSVDFSPAIEVVHRMGGTYYRRRNNAPRNPRTPRQTAHRDCFRAASKLASQLKVITNVTYAQLAQQQSTTPHALLMRHLLAEVVLFDDATHSVVIHYDRIRLQP